MVGFLEVIVVGVSGLSERVGVGGGGKGVVGVFISVSSVVSCLVVN